MNSKRLLMWALVVCLLTPAVAFGTLYRDFGGHRYVIVSTPAPVTWESAQLAAADAQGGYLVRITSDEENQFVFDFLIETVGGSAAWNKDNYRWYWLGGYRSVTYMPDVGVDPGPADQNWAWATDADGQTEDWGWTDSSDANNDNPAPWYPSEPNNGYLNSDRAGKQNYLHYDPRSPDAPLWDDLDNSSYLLFPGSWGMRGYVVEYSYLAPVPAPAPTLLIVAGLVGLRLTSARRTAARSQSAAR